MANTNQDRSGQGQGGQNQQGGQSQQGQGQQSSSGNSSSASSSSHNRGFAAMDQNRAREIQSQGGKAVSQDRQHMAEIGRKGGEHSRGNTSNRGQSSNQERNEHANFSDISAENP